MIIDFHTHLGISMPWVPTEEFNTPVAELIGVMDANAIDRAVCCANTVVGETYSIANNYIAQAISQHTDRLYAFCRVDPRLLLVPDPTETDPVVWDNVMRAPARPRTDSSWVYDEVHRCITELGFSGIKLHPVEEAFAPENPIFAPIFEWAADLDVPVQIHCDRVTSFTGRPQRILECARQYPDVRICAVHLYAPETIEFLSQVDNVHIEISEVAKGELITRAIDAVGVDRVLYGSDYPYGDPKVILAVLRALGLDDETLDRILSANALRLLGA